MRDVTPTKMQEQVLACWAREVLVASDVPATGRTTALMLAAARQPGAVLIAPTYPATRTLHDECEDFFGRDCPRVTDIEGVHSLRGSNPPFIGVDDIHRLEREGGYVHLLAMFPRARFMATVLNDRRTPAWVFYRWPHLRPIVQGTAGDNPNLPVDFYDRWRMAHGTDSLP